MILQNSYAAPAICITSSTPAMAENTEHPHDIILTAQRMEQRLQDVSISITVFKQQQISHNNIVNAADLGASRPTPNMVLKSLIYH